MFGEEKNMAKLLQVAANFGTGLIKLTCWNQKVTDWNIRHKIYISQVFY